MPGGALMKVFIYNNTISMKEETQAQNLLYYYPAALPLDEQLMDIGISGAFQGFHSNFDSTTPISSMCSDHYQFAWYMAEPEFMLGVGVRRQPETAGFIEDPERSGLSALLRQGYRMYRLHFGTMSKHYKDTLDELRQRLKVFWDVYVQWMAGPVTQGLDLFDALDGIKYLPVDRAAYLKMQSIVNHLEAEFPPIKASMVIIDNLLLYTGINLEDTHILYKFMVRRQRQGSRPSVSENLLHLSHPNARGDETYVGFLTPACGLDSCKGGLRQLVSEKVLGKRAPAEHTPINMWLGPFQENGSDGQPLTKHTLVVFQSARIIMVFFCDPEETRKQPSVNGTFYRNLQSSLVATLAKSTSVTENITKSIVWDENYQYIYFNRMNMAMKSSLKRKGTEQEHLRYVERLQSEFEEFEGMKEAWARTRESTWVVGRKSGSREFYSVFEGKSHLSEAHEEVKRVSRVFFNGIFVD